MKEHLQHSVPSHLKSIGPIAPNWAVRFIYPLLFKFTQQNTADFTKNRNWAPHSQDRP